MKEDHTFNIPINDEVVEIIPGMREQGKAVTRLYVESDYAPCHAVMVVNPSSILVPDCQFSPVMGPVVFGQRGPLPGMPLVKLLTKNGQPIVPAKVTVSIR